MQDENNLHFLKIFLYLTFSGIYAYVKKIKKMLDKMRGVCFISNTARRGPGRAVQVKKPSQEGEGFGE